MLNSWYHQSESPSLRIHPHLPGANELNQLLAVRRRTAANCCTTINSLLHNQFSREASAGLHRASSYLFILANDSWHNLETTLGWQSLRLASRIWFLNCERRFKPLPNKCLISKYYFLFHSQLSLFLTTLLHHRFHAPVMYSKRY